MGDIKPTHKLSQREGQETCYECESCGIEFYSDPCTGDNMSMVHHRDAGEGWSEIMECCPFDPASDSEVKVYLRMDADGTAYTKFIEFQNGKTPEDFDIISRSWFQELPMCHHSFDCCGCWHACSSVKGPDTGTKDGWTIYSRRYYKNV